MCVFQPQREFLLGSWNGFGHPALQNLRLVNEAMKRKFEESEESTARTVAEFARHLQLCNNPSAGLTASEHHADSRQ